MDRIRNERIRWTLKVGGISKKVQEIRLQAMKNMWGRVMRMDVEGRKRKTKAEVDGQCKCGL